MFYYTVLPGYEKPKYAPSKKPAYGPINPATYQPDTGCIREVDFILFKSRVTNRLPPY